MSASRLRAGVAPLLRDRCGRRGHVLTSRTTKPASARRCSLCPSGVNRKKPIELRTRISSFVSCPVTTIGSVKSAGAPGRSTRYQSRRTPDRPGRWFRESLQKIASNDSSGNGRGRPASTSWKRPARTDSLRALSPWRPRSVQTGTGTAVLFPAKASIAAQRLVCSGSLGGRLAAEAKPSFTSVAVREPFHACVGARRDHPDVRFCLLSGHGEPTSGLQSGKGVSACSSSSFRSPDLEVGAGPGKFLGGIRLQARVLQRARHVPAAFRNRLPG